MTSLLTFKALHIIGFVAWFGGLFYLVRIMVYHREAFDLTDPAKTLMIQQFELMEQRAYRIICTPALVFTWICGLGMLSLYGIEWFVAHTWIQVKMVLLTGLTIYHFYCGKIISQLKNQTIHISSFQFRLLNEVPTLFLASIVIIAVFKNLTQFSMVFSGIVLFGLILYLFAKWYKRLRKAP